MKAVTTDWGLVFNPSRSSDLDVTYLEVGRLRMVFHVEPLIIGLFWRKPGRMFTIKT